MKGLIVAFNGLFLLAAVLFIGSYMGNPASASPSDSQNKQYRMMMSNTNTGMHGTRHRRHRRHHRRHRRHHRRHTAANTM